MLLSLPQQKLLKAQQALYPKKRKKRSKFVPDQSPQFQRRNRETESERPYDAGEKVG
jgi:hypothetical protein